MHLPFMATIAFLCSAGALAGCLYLIATVVIMACFPKQPAGTAPPVLPVTILKPLCGDDYELAANLRSFCRQDYGQYQIVFGIQRADDPALPVVRAIMAEFPHVDIALVIDSQRQSHNMKIANLQNMLPAAKYPYLVMADSDMRVTPCYLADVVAPLVDPTVGAVTCLYRGQSGGGLWSQLACLQINHNFLPQAILGELMQIGDGCFGATIAMRRDTLDSIGGFQTIGHALADDHMLGQALRAKGKRIVLSRHIIDNIIIEPDFDTLYRHELRWARTVCIMQRNGYIASVITFPWVFALLATVTGALPALTYPLLAAVAGLRLLAALAVTLSLRLPFWSLALVPVRDLLSFAVFVASFRGNAVQWRGQTFHINPSGSIILDGDAVS